MHITFHWNFLECDQSERIICSEDYQIPIYVLNPVLCLFIDKLSRRKHWYKNSYMPREIGESEQE